MINKLIEALLFIRGEKGVSSKQLKIASKLSTADSRKALQVFAKEYNSLDRGLQVLEFDDVFKMATTEEVKSSIEDLITVEKKQRLSNASIETAGIIAYKQPITKSQISDIRGVSSEAVVNTLLVKGLIEEKGIANTHGSPVLYGISNQFYDYFGISSLKELPKLTEFNEDEGLDDDFDLFSSQRQD